MNTEQKAKAYDEALKRAREWSETKNGYYTPKELCEEIFPVLKESEDERIRKELIEYIKDQQSSFISPPDCRDKYEEEENNKYNSWLAWLEKQEEKHITEPQSRWWPSEKQMRMLHRAIEVKAPGVVRDGLESLYNDLKNL